MNQLFKKIKKRMLSSSTEIPVHIIDARPNKGRGLFSVNTKGGKVMSCVQRPSLPKFTVQYHKMIQIGKIVSVVDPEHPEYMEELFLVVGFQEDIYSFNNKVAIMDDQGRVFLTDIDKLILKSMFTIEDMFPVEPTDMMWLVNRHEVQ